MPDINLFGITYMQQISETSSGTGLHIEPGIWVNVPATSNPDEPTTVVRMASIPHGTVILAQGQTQFLNGGPPHIPDNNIIPFGIGGNPPPNSQLRAGRAAVPRAQPLPQHSVPARLARRDPGDGAEPQQRPSSRARAARRSRIGHSSGSRPRTPRSRAAGPRTRRSSRRRRTPRAATPTPSRSTPPSGSRPSPEPAATPTSFSCSTRSSWSSISTA